MTDVGETIYSYMGDSLLSEEHLLPERRIGAHTLEYLIQCGQYADIWRARHPVLGPVALKVAHSPTYAAKESIRTESICLRTLGNDHPGIVHSLETQPQHSPPYLTLEYLEGVNLSQILSKTPLHPQVALWLVSSIADAMVYIHDHDILHLDLKPANVMIVPDSRHVIVPKVIDFSISRTPGEYCLEWPDDEGFCGTPAYIAPEALRIPLEDLDELADIYSLAKILHESLTGEILKPPLRSNFAESLIFYATLAQERRFIPPSHVHPELAPYDLLLMRSLAHDRYLRHPSMGSLKKDLDLVRVHLAEKSKASLPELLGQIAQRVVSTDERVTTGRMNMKRPYSGSSNSRQTQEITSAA